MNFTLSEDRCVWLLVRILCRCVPECIVLEELKSLNIRIQEVTRMRSGHREQDPAKLRPPNATFVVSLTRGPKMSKV